MDVFGIGPNGFRTTN